ncbi:hypothetical protein ES703_96426 [subsurface metagenome]
MDHLEAKLVGGDIEQLGVVDLPHSVAFGAAEQQGLGACLPDLFDVALGQLPRLVNHAHRVEDIAAAPLVGHEHERSARGLEYLYRRLGNLGAGVSRRAADEVEHIGLFRRFDVAGQPLVAVGVGGAEAVMLFGYILGHLFVLGHGALAVLDRLYAERLEGELYFQVEVALTAHVAGAAEGAGIEYLEQFVGIFHPAFEHSRPDSHLAVGAVGVE